MYKKDRIFSVENDRIQNFQFDERVASVFDDMIERSVPIYHHIHQLISDLYISFIPSRENNIVYDLGCSTGETLLTLLTSLQKKGHILPHCYGVDSSQPMLNQFQKKLHKSSLAHKITLQCRCLKILRIDPPHLIIMNYTLQFLEIEERSHILKNIFNSLRSKGILILTEKIRSSSKMIEKMSTKLYYNFKKKNHYSDLEILQKREALENILIPSIPEEQIKELKKAGFKEVDLVFRWYNFACYIAVKG